jgi:hypothetical protein
MYTCVIIAMSVYAETSFCVCFYSSQIVKFRSQLSIAFIIVLLTVVGKLCSQVVTTKQYVITLHALQIAANNLKMRIAL